MPSIDDLLTAVAAAFPELSGGVTRTSSGIQVAVPETRRTGADDRRDRPLPTVYSVDADEATGRLLIRVGASRHVELDVERRGPLSYRRDVHQGSEQRVRRSISFRRGADGSWGRDAGSPDDSAGVIRRILAAAAPVGWHPEPGAVASDAAPSDAAPSGAGSAPDSRRVLLVVGIVLGIGLLVVGAVVAIFVVVIGAIAGGIAG